MGMKDDLFWMQQAYEQALDANKQGEIPVGAVLVGSDNALLGLGHNQVIQCHDPCAHAEILAIRQACEKTCNHRLLNATLYVTLEPCVICAGAIIQARLARVVFATRDFKGGAAGSVYNLLQGYPLNHRVMIDEGIMQEGCAMLLSDFFKVRR